MAKHHTDIGTFIATDIGISTEYGMGMKPPAYPPLWARLCEKVKLPPDASINRVLNAYNHAVGHGTLQRIREGGEPHMASVRKLADYIGCSVSELTADESNVESERPIEGLARVPIVGEVKGGENGHLEELQYPVGHGDGYVEYPTRDPRAYALRVRGDSMHPRFRAGEFVIVAPSLQAQESDDVIVCCTDGQKLLKQLNWIRGGEVQLVSINNGYAPMTIPMAMIESIQLVIGRVLRSGLLHD